LASFRHIATRESGLLTAFYLVELLRTHRFLFEKSFVTLQCRFRQGQIGLCSNQLLLGGKLGCGGAINSGSRLGVVDYGEHLTALNTVSFVHPELDDIPHHLARGVTGLGGGHAGLLHGEHGNVSHGFRRRSRAGFLVRAAGEGTNREQHQKRKSAFDVYTIHGITTGDCGFKLPLANSRLA
jgi:hypothetical protein